MKIKIASSFVLLLLVACSQEAPPAPAAADPGQVTATPAEAAPAPEVVAPAVVPPLGDSTLSVSPGSFRACEAEGGAVVATAKWDVVDKGVQEVAIYVQSPGNARTLWLNGGATGESTTGNWVFDKTTFSMVERGTEKPLAELVVNAVPCE